VQPRLATPRKRPLGTPLSTIFIAIRCDRPAARSRFRIVKNPAESARGKGLAKLLRPPSRTRLLLLPGLAGVDGGPELLRGSCDSSALGIGEHDAGDVPGQRDSGS
jgi:hypothetical protein